MDSDQNNTVQNNSIDQLQLDKFEQHLRVLWGLQPSSTGRYRAHVAEFFTWRRENDIHTPFAAAESRELQLEVEDYLTWCYRKGNSNTTRLAKLTAIQNYFRYLMHNRELAADPTADIPKPPADSSGMLTFTRPEVLRMFGTIDITLEKGLRDTVFLILGAFAGFRVSEITKFNIEDVIDDGEQIDLDIPKTKKKAHRTVWIWKAPGAFIRQLVLARLAQGAKTGDPLLVSYKKNGTPRESASDHPGAGRRLTTCSCDRLLKKLAIRAGIRKAAVKTHMLRATHANDLQLIRGYGLPQILERMGWKHLSTAERYLVRRERIHRTYNNLHEYWIEFTKIWTKKEDANADSRAAETRGPAGA